MLHLPFVFAKNKPEDVIKSTENKLETFIIKDSLLTIPSVKAENIISNIYDSLRLNLIGLSHQAFQIAMQGFDYLTKAGKFTNDRIISIVDFSQPSFKKRLFVIDLDKMKVLFNTYVAHGINSGTEYANQFSNNPNSNKNAFTPAGLFSANNKSFPSRHL